MKIMITGGTGTVGSATVQRMLQAGLTPQVLVRSPEKAAALPAGAAAVAGDLQQPDTLATAFAGVDRLFLLTALAPDETQQGLNAVAAARQAGVRRLVYMSIHRLESALHIPHFGSKKPIQDAIAASGMEYTFIQPNNFFQVDLWFREAMVQYGVYPQPIGGIGMNRVDVRDIADAVVNALTQEGHHGAAYPLIGRDALTASQVAGIWSRHLGREVHYAGDDLDAWAAQSRRFMPEWLVHDLRIMYDYFQKHGLPAAGEEFALQDKVLQHAPRRFEDFVRETAAAWKA
jgi:uncharacterized protein YbjT (DUF2867 family)